MKILILGSTQFRGEMVSLMLDLEGDHDVRLPAFDDYDGTALALCEHNIELIKWCDEVRAFWDGRSQGFVFDMGAVMALGKPVKFEYFETKTLAGVFRGYADKCRL